MKLIKARVTNFRSIEDSNEFEIGQLTCLVGKNESGKTAVLQALYGLNPFKKFTFDKTRDYPRRLLSKFNQGNPEEKSEVICTWWKLDEAVLKTIYEQYGRTILTDDVVRVHAGIGYSGTLWTIPCNEKKYLASLALKHRLGEDEKRQLNDVNDTASAAGLFQSLENKSDGLKAFLEEIKELRQNSLVLSLIDFISQRMPKFFYTSHYDRMSGEIALNKLVADKANQKLSPGDKIFLDFLEYSGTSIEDLQQATKHEELKAQCEGASNTITDEIFDFWSQNEALSVEIDLGEGKPEDEPPFNQGTVAKIRIRNQNHRASVPLSERSAGFVWFFSFLSQFKQLQNTTGNAIILLDEPGLTLHGKAQSDLLRYIQERLLPNHQVIYSTHSPFMVPADRLADVRVVEDVIKYENKKQPTVYGTKVSSDVLSVNKDTIFPLQGHLGYELTQSLFIGKNTLLVEGPSDILYLQALSNALKNRAREGLDPAWVMCPTGGIDKIQSFASLFGGNNLNIAVLSDYASGDKKKIQRLKESQLLNSEQIFTVSDFTGKPESDIEDLLGSEIFSYLLNNVYILKGDNKIDPKRLSDSMPKTERVVKQTENVFKSLSDDVPEFDHFSPSSWLIRNPKILESNSDAIITALNMAEKVFKKLNELIEKN